MVVLGGGGGSYEQGTPVVWCARATPLSDVGGIVPGRQRVNLRKVGVGDDPHCDARGHGLLHKHRRTLKKFRGSLRIRNCLLLGPYSRPMPRALRWSWGRGQFLMSEVPL